MHGLATWQGGLELPALPAKVESLEVLTGGKAEYRQNGDKLIITMAPADISPVNTVIKLTVDKPVSEITPIRTVNDPVSLGATATASSFRGDKNGPQNVIASDTKEFSEGIVVKSSWGPASQDQEPWLEVKLAAPESVSQVKLMEGRFGNASRVQEYMIEAGISNGWKTIHTGTSIGGDCNIILSAPEVSDSFRLRILEWDGYMDLNSFELYE